jgi:hypothetical protein
LSRGDDDAFRDRALSVKLVPLREDLEFNLYRGWQQMQSIAVLVVALATQHPSPQSRQLLEHEYSLTSEVDSGWAAKPLALIHQEGPTILVSV